MVPTLITSVLDIALEPDYPEISMLISKYLFFGTLWTVKHSEIESMSVFIP